MEIAGWIALSINTLVTSLIKTGHLARLLNLVSVINHSVLMIFVEILGQVFDGV